MHAKNEHRKKVSFDVLNVVDAIFFFVLDMDMS